MSILDLLSEHKVCRINLPTRTGTALTVECVARCTSDPHIETVFLPKTLPVGELDPTGYCQLYFEVGSKPYALKTKITEIIKEDRLQLSFMEMFSPTQQREYFRVDTKVSITFSLYPADVEDIRESFQGDVNLSGCGIYFPTQLPAHVRSKIILHIMLSEPFGELGEIIGEVVRIHRSRRQKQWIGVKFLQISTQDRDRLIAFCLAEQRRILRQRVQLIATA